MNINSLIKAIRDTKITFYKPTKVELLVFDQNGINTISPFLKKKIFYFKNKRRRDKFVHFNLSISKF